MVSGFRHIHRNASWVNCLIHVNSELARLGLELDDLEHYQAETLDELEEGLNERALADMLRWWKFESDSPQALTERPSKPRIEVWMEFDQRGNFSVAWQPRGLQSLDANSDWPRGRKSDDLRNARPWNELIYLPGLGDVESKFRAYALPSGQDDTTERAARLQSTTTRHTLDTHLQYQLRDRFIDSMLLICTAALVKLLMQRLEFHFDVTRGTDIYMAFDNSSERSGDWDAEDRLVTWEIDNVARRTEAADLAELSLLEERIGCSRNEVLEAYAEVHSRGKKDGEAGRLSKLLKKRGNRAATPAPLRRLLEILHKYEPARLPGFEGSLQGNVVPFKSK